jgi:hypothetical protein
MARLNGAIGAGTLRFRGGETVQHRLDGGLVREDGAVLYPIILGIPHLTIDQAIRLEQLDADR